MSTIIAFTGFSSCSETEGGRSFSVSITLFKEIVLLLYNIGIFRVFYIIYPLVRGPQVCQFYLLRVLPSVTTI